MKFNWYQILFTCAHNGHSKQIKSMPSYDLHTSSDAEQMYTGKLVELILAQGASIETAHFITKLENYLLSQWHLQGTWQLTVPQGLPETQPGNPLR